MIEKINPEDQVPNSPPDNDFDLTSFIDGTGMGEIIEKARKLYPEAYQKYLDSLKKKVRENLIGDVDPDDANEQLRRLFKAGEK